MADTVKISELPLVTTSSAADSIPIVQGGVTKRIHPGPAGGLDADTISGYGIGTSSSSVPADLDSILGGFSQFIITTLHRPTLDIPTMVNYGICLTFPYYGGGQYPVQMAFDTAGKCAVRNKLTGSWSVWKSQWNAFNDGNDGQPPAPKPKAYSSGLTPGEVTVAKLTDTATWTNPGGTWEYLRIVFTAVAVPVFQPAAAARDVTTGNLSGYGSGYYTTYYLWRTL